MATGHICKKVNDDGVVKYQVVVEDPSIDPNKKRPRRWKTVATKKEAKLVLSKMIQEIESGGIPTSSKMKLSEWMDTWLNTYLPNIEATTRAGYRDNIRNHILPDLGNLQLNKVTTYHIQCWLNKLHTEKNLCPKTVLNIYRNLYAALDKATKLRMISFNPCTGVELPRQPREQKGCTLTKEEVVHILKVTEGTEMHLFFLLCVYAGLRRGELAALTWDDIDFDNKIIHITRSTVVADGKKITKAPKSKAGIRSIPFGENVETALKKAHTEYLENKQNMGRSFTDSNLVICQKNGKGYQNDSLTQKWERFRTTVNLDHVRMHDLRHTCATLLVNANIDPKTAQTWMGHADFKVTYDVYAHSLKSTTTAAAETMDNTIFS